MAFLKTLDLNTFCNGSIMERQQFAQSLKEGLREHGFVKLVNHGFSDDDINQLFNWNKRFFALGKEQKEKIMNFPNDNPQRGWSGVGIEKTSTLNPAGKTNLTRCSHKNLHDAKEHFDIGPSCDTQFPNQWPSEVDIPGFETWVTAYFDKSYQIALDLLGALEFAFDMPQGSFVKKCAGHASELRLNHYPAISTDTLEIGTTRRIWPHTDFGLITLLAQDDNGGLEIQDPNQPGEFLPVMRNHPSELVVNAGDCLERWTNGIIKAGLHQVTTPSHVKQKKGEMLPARHSVAFFLKAARGASVGPFEKFVDGVPLYEDMTALAYHKQRQGIVY
ncbi:hypothetical protein COCCADRAFT_10506 [Bipolaris zeicola 26-R-13]|uniref:Fe2OG dioxygenase domain-containing protein n=1 Tax=Cochliobolus carbonum (strain 26-R-13) TaxID=930089 RepID=W6XN67_COCC2|nr:uncharacterized protein COCCADRAFT_10506 [Bipolaris zeicola 26-R-13]EUC26695.1 hypothetical protein COCCADRAFT_10506 [Bipolaris zeicola 26-R-13]